MSNDESNDFYWKLKTTIENNIKQDVIRHIELGADASIGKLIENAAKREIERLNKTAQQFDEERRDEIADVIQAIKDDVIPAILHELRYRR